MKKITPIYLVRGFLEGEDMVYESVRYKNEFEEIKRNHKAGMKYTVQKFPGKEFIYQDADINDIELENLKDGSRPEVECTVTKEGFHEDIDIIGDSGVQFLEDIQPDETERTIKIKKMDKYEIEVLDQEGFLALHIISSEEDAKEVMEMYSQDCHFNATSVLRKREVAHNLPISMLPKVIEDNPTELVYRVTRLDEAAQEAFQEALK